jgi:hypothetical protein
LALALTVYAHLSGAWIPFAIWFLAPDLAFAAYLFGPRAGATAYNVTHSYAGPALLALAGIAWAPALVEAALIWASHVAFDRMLGYGLKSRAGFTQTHLGPIGHAAS